MVSPPASPSKNLTQMEFLREFLENIKFSHSVFALPFALMSLLLVRRGRLPTPKEVGLIIACMVTARTWAMGMNRVIDAKIDAQNPRTQGRSIPAGRLQNGTVVIFSLAAAILFCFTTFFLSQQSFYLSIPTLLILAAYSYMKRFTFLCHYWLGMCLGLAPVAVWVALGSSVPLPVVLLMFAICFWVGGFDIIYALQDLEFDKSQRLYSIPAHFGVKTSLWIARLSHILALGLFIYFGYSFNLGWIYYAGLTLISALMIWEHRTVREGNLEKIQFAFFNLNGWIAVLLLFFVSLNLLFLE